jgi:ribonuclease R
MLNKETVQAFFREKSSRPMSFREIIRLMGLSKSEARSLKRVLREMLHNGEIVLTRKGLYGPADDMNLVTGYFESHRDGYGFVISEKPGERDIFIPPRGTLGAMKNDRVVVRIGNWKRREGRIIRILERANSRVAGRLDVSKTTTYVRPKKRSIPFDIYIAPKDRGKAKHGDTVIAEITTYPTEKRPPSGKVVKIIKKPEDTKSEIEAIIDEFGLPKRFPKTVNDATKLFYMQLESNFKSPHSYFTKGACLSGRQGQRGIIKGQEKFSGVRLPKRKDLRTLPTVTIDGERAKDFDDAISIGLTEHGYRLWVHIADVGFYVPWDSVIDLEARKRATSVYLPDRVMPMFPKVLSEDLCSLKPRIERYAFTLEMDFDRYGRKINTKFYPSVIKSDERMTYTSVKKIIIDQDSNESKRYGHLLEKFELMGELSGILRSNRLERGSLDFDLPEPEVVLDLQGNPEAIIKAERNYAHMIIEEFMIAANEAVAVHIEKLGVPGIYRVHEEPDPMKLDDIARVVKPLGILKKGTLKPGDFSDLLKSIKNKAEEEIMNHIVLRSLKQARYSTINVGHFGLASDCYTHFTSPIRRYPDLIMHRILRETMMKKHMSDKRIKVLESMLTDIAFHSSRMERAAEEAEREVIDAVRVWFMKDKVGDEFEGKIIGVTPYGLKVQLKDFFIEGFLHVSYLTDDYYQYNDKTMRLSGRHTKRSFRIGQVLKLRVDRLDMEEREIIFGL